MANSPLNSTFTNIDILRLAKLPTGSLPAAGAGNEGAIAYDDTTNTIKFSNGSSWANVGSGVSGTGVADQLAYWSGSGTIAGDTGLTYNSSTNVLTVSGGVVTNGPAAFGSQTFTINSATDTIPSDTQIVRLISSIGDVTLTGTPTIAAGQYEGQRLITILDTTSTGDITFANIPSCGYAIISSPNTLTFVAGNPQEAMEWVWVQGLWKSVSTPAQNSLKVNIIPENILFGVIPDIAIASRELGFHTTLLTDPSSSVSVSADKSLINIDLTGGDIEFTATPTLSATFTAFTVHQIVLIRNISTSGYHITLQDNSLLAGSDLFLATPKCILRENDWIQLVYDRDNDVWIESSRSRVHRQEISPTLSGASSLDPRGADTLRLILSAAASGDTPTIISGYGYENQELTLWNDPANADSFTIEDEGTTPGTNLRLSATSLVLTPGSSVKLRYDATSTKWYEVSHTILV